MQYLVLTWWFGHPHHTVLSAKLGGLESVSQAPRGSEEGRRAETDLLPLDQSKGSRLVVVDGVLAPQLSDLSSLPEGVYVGSIASAPDSSKPQLALLVSLEFCEFGAEVLEPCTHQELSIRPLSDYTLLVS